MLHCLVSAAHKSSGKTTLSVGLCAALRERGIEVAPFKKGPDFIDPLWLGAASGRACYNLDFHTMTPEAIEALRRDRAAGAGFALIEGNKGLHDGVALDGSDSNAALAKLLDTPVVLVIDTRGITRGVAPLIEGYRRFDGAVRFAGVVLNFVGGPRHEGKLRAAIEHYTDLAVLGAVGRDEAIALDEAHLGLHPPNEVSLRDEVVDRIRRRVEEEVDVDAVLAAAGREADRIARPPARAPAPVRARVGIARDAAFGFYYPDDLEALERAGAALVEFDTLRDRALPPVDALFIGGGFPERHMAALERNESMRESIRAALAAGMPAYAECGGLMYLARGIRWEGRTHRMVGALPADVVMHRRPQGRGYVVLEETGESPWLRPGEAPARRRIHAHEFHHSSLEGYAPGDFRFAYRVLRGHGVDGALDGLAHGNVLASYAHLRSVAGHDWAAAFVDFVVRTGAGRPRSAAGASPRA